MRLRDLTPQVIARFRAELEGAGVGSEAIRKTMTMLQEQASDARHARGAGERHRAAAPGPGTKRPRPGSATTLRSRATSRPRR